MCLHGHACVAQIGCGSIIIIILILYNNIMAGMYPTTINNRTFVHFWSGFASCIVATTIDNT